MIRLEMKNLSMQIVVWWQSTDLEEIGSTAMQIENGLSLPKVTQHSQTYALVARSLEKSTNKIIQKNSWERVRHNVLL